MRQHKSQTLAFADKRHVALFIATLLSSCATELPITVDAPQILELHCNSDKSVVATAIRASGMQLETDGEILHSIDGGLTWSPAARGSNLRGVAPRFFSDPRDKNAANRLLVVTGYKSSGFQWTYQLGGWMKSTDSGKTWEVIAPRLPAVKSADPIGWPPNLVVVDPTGRLATIGESTTILISDDQGIIWIKAKLPEFDYFAELYELYSDGRGRLVAVGRSSSLLKEFGVNRTVVVYSDDSGKTWSIALSKSSSASCIPRVIGNPDGSMLINTGCAGTDRHYFFSTDGGRTWQERRFYRYAYGTFELIRALDDKRWIAISREGQSLFAWISDNGGGEWRGYPTGYSILSGNPHLEWQSIVTLPSGVVLFYAGDGQILRSANRGESWKLIDAGLPRQGKYSLGASCSDGRGLVVLGGEQGMLVRSPDEGLTWERGQLH
ncbi:MAG: sialidase family protein [Gallionella sp.]|nr:sialidase family protein [Gallionella sp.]